MNLQICAKRLRLRLLKVSPRNQTWIVLREQCTFPLFVSAAAHRTVHLFFPTPGSASITLFSFGDLAPKVFGDSSFACKVRARRREIFDSHQSQHTSRICLVDCGRNVNTSITDGFLASIGPAVIPRVVRINVNQIPLPHILATSTTTTYNLYTRDINKYPRLPFGHMGRGAQSCTEEKDVTLEKAASTTCRKSLEGRAQC